MTRRDFVVTSLAAAQAARGASSRPTLCLFSKHLPKLNYEQLGKQVKDFGFDGVDLTVRSGGHVLPERAAEDMPRAIETLRAHGLTVPMITTELTSASHPTAQPVLSTAGKLGVPFYKLGYWRYRGRDPEAAIGEVRRDARALAGLGWNHRLVAGMHNHSGDYIGAAVWDTRAIIADLEPQAIGYYFDPCHATAEGGVDGWEISLRMALPRIKMVALKDFYWAKDGGKWKMTMCPMGEGMVQWPKVFSMIAAARFTGPISLHMEYDAADELAAIARDFAFARKQIATAYGVA